MYLKDHITSISRNSVFSLSAGILIVLSVLPVADAEANKNSEDEIGEKDQPVISLYSNSSNRPDPFLPVRLKAQVDEGKSVGNNHELRIQGIVMHPTRPVAVINRQSVKLNETVTFKLSSGDLTAKAIVIERDRVVLKIADREIELQLEH